MGRPERGQSAHHAHAFARDGSTIYDKPVKQDEKAIRTMLERLSERGRPLLVVDQPNTIGSLPLTVARSMGITVTYLPGGAMHKASQLLPGSAKTDQRDARVIAWAALKLPETLKDAGNDDETLAAQGMLAGHDEDLAHEATRHINRMRGLLLQIHPAFEHALKGERITRDSTLALLERYGGPTGMKEAGAENVKEWAKANGLRTGVVIDDMFRAIGEQTVTVPGTRMAESIIPTLARNIKAIKDRRREVGRQVETLLEDHPLLTVLTSMPGIGVRTASGILLGIGGDITNFKNALWQTAFVASTKHPPSIAYYRRKREQGKHHNAAIICLARRRCDVIYSMFKNGTLYQDPHPRRMKLKRPATGRAKHARNCHRNSNISTPHEVDKNIGTPPNGRARRGPPPQRAIR